MRSVDDGVQSFKPCDWYAEHAREELGLSIGRGQEEESHPILLHDLSRQEVSQCAVYSV